MCPDRKLKGKIVTISNFCHKVIVTISVFHYSARVGTYRWDESGLAAKGGSGNGGRAKKLHTSKATLADLTQGEGGTKM